MGSLEQLVLIVASQRSVVCRPGSAQRLVPEISWFLRHGGRVLAPCLSHTFSTLIHTGPESQGDQIVLPATRACSNDNVLRMRLSLVARSCRLKLIAPSTTLRAGPKLIIQQVPVGAQGLARKRWRFFLSTTGPLELPLNIKYRDPARLFSPHPQAITSTGLDFLRLWTMLLALRACSNHSVLRERCAKFSGQTLGRMIRRTSRIC